MNRLHVVILFLLLYACSFTSCRSWQESRAVTAMADSIDQTHHVIYDDTAALGQTIRQLDNPFGRLFMRNTLGKAYYYMGRNHSLSNRISEAAECYIEADRLQIDDPIYRGRVNTCMGYICTQNNIDSLALIFYERAGEDVQESGNDWYYAQNLLSRAAILINLHQFTLADNTLHMAHSYQLDSAYIARLYETKGLYFYEQQQYDSALVYFHKGLDYWQGEEAKCFSYLKIMQVYLEIEDLTKALPYSQLIIKNSNNPNYISNAYYCLMQSAEQEGNITLVSNYASSREDMNRLLEKHKESYTQAVTIIEDYKLNPHPWLRSWILVVCCIILCIIFIIGIVVYRRFTIAQLKVSSEQIISLSAQIKKQTDELHNHNAQHDYDKRLYKIRRKYPKPRHQWNNYDQLKKDVNPYLQSWLIALEKLNLTQRENVFCVLSFIYPQMSIEDLANSMCISKDALMVRKTRMTKKIGITSAQLNNFLQNLSITE